MMFLLQCPKCKNRMKYQTADISIFGKKKVCVYCGFRFSVSENIIGKVAS